MKVDVVTVRVLPAAPFLLRVQGIKLLRSLGYFTPQLPEHPQALADGVDRDVDRAQSLLRDRDGAEVDDAHERAGRLIAASIDFVMCPAKVRS